MRPALSIQELDKLKPFEELIKFKKTPHLDVLLSRKEKIIGLFTGNQAGKTANAAYQYVLRVIGIHPIADKNRLGRNIRCLSSSLPESDDPHEGSNTQYLELKKLMPSYLITKDITARGKTLVVNSPVHGKSYFEFISYNQDIQNTARVQRDSLWGDEEAPKAYREESRRRLLSRNGDEIITLTPKNGLTYLYDDLWNKKHFLWRSPTIQKALNLPEFEHDEKGDNEIACIQIATDDNPTMTKEQVDINFASEDADDLLVSRYGVFRQIAGTVHKAYNREVHFIDYRKYFPNHIPFSWTHARGIDYHESRTPWSVGWLSASPEDEWFLWNEYHPAIDGAYAMSTYEIATSIVRQSRDYIYHINLIDPLANKKQSNTNTSVTEDLNWHFKTLREQHGLGTKCLWEGWDTKGTGGRDEIHTRLKNALQVRRPFNNVYRDRGEKRTLPTLWICDTCPNFDQSIRKWSYEDWANVRSKAVKDPKPTPMQRHSHDNMVLECLAKDNRLHKWARPDFKYVPGGVTGRGAGMVFNGLRI